MRAAILALGLMAACTLACVGGPDRVPAPRESAPPAALVPSQEIEGSFLVRQHIAFTAGERTGDFEAVVQQYCGELVVAGISPMGMKLFTLTQSGLDVSVEAMQAERWPFEPERILLDVHRTYFYPLADPPPSDGVHESRFAGVRLRERWGAGRLIEREVAVADGEAIGWLVIRYGEGGPPGGSRDPRWRSSKVRLSNPLYGYELEIETAEYQTLRCEE